MLKEEIRDLHDVASGAEALQRRFEPLPGLRPPGATISATQQLIIGSRGLLHQSGSLIALRQMEERFRRSRVRAPSFQDRAIGVLHLCFISGADSLLPSQLRYPQQD